MDMSQNYFELFELPVAFDVDRDALAQRYRQLQQVVHPDRYASATESEQRIALQHATWVNEAFDTLKDPLRRAMYQLKLAGVDLNQETATTRDGAFLMAQMELREAISEVEQTSDPFASLDSLMRDIRQLLKQQLESLAAQLNDGSDEALKDAQEGVSKLQFLTKLQREAEAVEAKLEEAM